MSLTVDLSAAPTKPCDLILTHHTLGGQWEWDPYKVGTWLAQGQTCTTIDSDEMVRAIDWKRPLNANLLDWLLRNRHRIPSHWGECTLFWGTRFRTPRHRRCVRTLVRDRGGWRDGLHWFDDGFTARHPAVVWK
jgi:hypothetical protein